MKVIRLFVISIILCSIVLFSLSCTGNPTVSKPKNPLIGKWEAFSGLFWSGWTDVSNSNTITLEFLDDGTLIYTWGEFVKKSLAGSYRFIDQNRIELKFESIITTVVEFSISGDELAIQGTLPDVDAQAWKLRKVK